MNGRLPHDVATDFHIMLQSGRLFDLANPSSSDIEIEDIAHGLAHTCRYAGQCRSFYSVAEHSVLVSRNISHSKLAALLHDSAEAYVGDMSRPLKQLLPQYKVIEKRIEQVIFLRFGIDWPPSPDVKFVDQCVMAAEQDVLMPSGTNEWLSNTEVRAAEVEIRVLDPTAAKKMFLDRFNELKCDQAAEPSEDFVVKQRT